MVQGSRFKGYKMLISVTVYSTVWIGLVGVAFSHD